MDSPLAPFLETRAYAALKGATAEFTKMEGAVLDAKRHRLYIAISDATKGMSDVKGDLQLNQNRCGLIYQAELDANWSITSMKPVVQGGPYDPANTENACAVNSIANPDNLFVDPDGNLWIGEDTDAHANNDLWMWDGKELKRFATLPAGAEVSGLRITDGGDMFLNIQHPGANNMYPYNRATVGVINGYRAGVNFHPLGLPTGDDAHRLTVAAGEYQILGRFGELIPDDVNGARFGQRTNADGTFDIANTPDGNMFLPTNAAGTEGYLYSNVEARPGGLSKLYIRKQAGGGQEDSQQQQGQNQQSNQGNKAQGLWQVIEGENVDVKSIGGVWNLCNANVTSWNTGLTNEEYEPPVDAKWRETVAPMTAYLGRQANPYDYGYAVELTPSELGTKAVRHYTLGRGSHENATVMPDGKTVYLTDDHDDGVLTKFVADKAGDLSAGTLYGAKMVAQDGGFSVQWVKLGSGTDKAIQEGVRALDATFAK
jgi:secreted PhoX family phosphatase